MWLEQASIINHFNKNKKHWNITAVSTAPLFCVTVRYIIIRHICVDWGQKQVKATHLPSQTH